MPLSPAQKWLDAIRRRRARRTEEQEWLAKHEYPSRLDCYDWPIDQRPKP
jgi:hypothetical protein